MIKIVERGQKNRFLIVKFTFECNIGCRVCVENSTPNDKELLPLSKIEKAFKELENYECDMGLQGGEVMLYPEYCAEICEMWRKINKKGGHTHMITNGFWGKDPKVIDIMANRIKPDILMTTVDKWHQEFIPIESVNNITKSLYDHPTINVAFFQIYSKNYPLKTQEELGIICDKKVIINGNPLHFYGRGADVISRDHDDSPKWKEYNDEPIKCDNFGLSILPDGQIVANCPLERNGCYCGHVDIHNIAKIYDNLRRPVINYTGKTYNLSAICKDMRIHCMNKKWNF